jgi:hypothetical protein
MSKQNFQVSHFELENSEFFDKAYQWRNDDAQEEA